MNLFVETKSNDIRASEKKALESQEEQFRNLSKKGKIEWMKAVLAFEVEEKLRGFCGKDE